MSRITKLLIYLGLVMAVASCSKDEIIFDHEKPQFPTKEGAYLLEVIMPQGTAADDEIFILGAFNGGDSATVVKDLRWKLEKCENNNVKWGIYLFPKDFQNGASPVDGYTFVNVKQGIERSLNNQAVVHTELPSLGSRLNVTVDRWASFFEKPIDPEEIVHDGYAIYVEDKTTWESLGLYAWGNELPELFGGWPGAKPTGTIKIGTTTYKYFDTGEANKGLTYNIIFNNAPAGDKQVDGPAVVLDKDYYFTVTDNSWSESSIDPSITHDGYAIFICGNTGWDDVAMYAWGDGMPELFGSWPGISPTGTQTINGVTYQYFDTGEANKGLFYNFILNNNNNGKQFDLCSVALDRDYYFLVDGNSGKEIDPAIPPEIGPVDPDPEPETHPHTIYIENTLNWSTNALYAYGPKELVGGWPGKIADGETVIGGANYLVFNYNGDGREYTFIINDTEGQQIDGPTLTTDKDYYFKVTPDGWTEVSPIISNQYRIYIDDQTGWSAIAMYAWGDVEMFGGWPGALPNGTITEGGVTYKYFDVTGNGETEHLIFNNNNGGVQLPDFDVVVNRDYWLKVTPAEVVEIANPQKMRLRK